MIIDSFLFGQKVCHHDANLYMDNLKTQEKISEPHQIDGNCMGVPTVSRSTRKCNKTHPVGRFWEIGTRAFPIVCVLFFSICFSSFGILHHIGNAWLFLSISHSMERCSKTHPVRETWDKNTHFFPK